ncbi:hypothetical protein BLOT_002094 [Blomia tropicalis]|nr:hypothetical protein BLOT_002094 [Blomia tropicalis]
MWFLIILGWIGLIVLMCFFILSIAAGLYYLAELVEEYSVTSAKVIQNLNWIIISIYICLFLFEDLPAYLIICGLISHLNHVIILRSFPYFKLSSFSFITFIVLLIINHYLTFSYFAQVRLHFTQVLSYFTICQWTIPFAFFVSLSANDNTLPTTMDTNTQEIDLISQYFTRKSNRPGLLSFFTYAKESILPQQIKKSY